VAELPSGTVTFLFTDLEGSTRLWEEHRDAMQGALATHDELMRRAIASWRSRAFRMASGTVSQSLVEPSMSVNRKVTVPDGGPTNTALHRGRPARSGIGLSGAGRADGTGMPGRGRDGLAVPRSEPAGSARVVS